MANLNQAIERAAVLLAREPERAEREIRQVLATAPQDPRARLILASAQRRLGRHREAHAVLVPLAASFPRAARTQYELGLTSLALGRQADGEAALRRAVTLAPDLDEAWWALADTLFTRGDLEGARTVSKAHALAQVKDPALLPAARALHDDRLGEAEERLRAHLNLRPDHDAAVYLLAQVFMAQSRSIEAERLLRLYLKIHPENLSALFDLAAAQFRQQKTREAIAALDRILAVSPNDAAARNLLAASLLLTGDDDRGLELNEGLVREFPNQPVVWLNYGHALRAVGRRDQALAAYRRCLSLAPNMGAAFWAIGNLKVSSFTPAEEAEMDALAARADLSSEDRLHLHFALGKAAEDKADYARSFDHYAQGGAIWRAQNPFDMDHHLGMAAQSRALFTPSFFAGRRGWGAPAADPIFVVGLPRSGSTLVEQILASHSQVEGTMELPHIGLIALNLGMDAEGRPVGRGFPQGVADLSPDQARALGEQYLSETRIHRVTDRPRFVDKMPNNFHSIGLIHTILPNARIIDARRHPMATCFSCFKQHFAQGQSYSYDLIDLGTYYRDYLETMAHFDAVLPGRVHRVIYEDMVEDTEAQISALLAYCGLEFEESCLRFYENDRTVRTVSSEQVRRPIFREGLDQWRNFEPWLGPLKEALGPALETWRG
jgi:tetratricopeptide (TPR) repeat protein